MTDAGDRRVRKRALKYVVEGLHTARRGGERYFSPESCRLCGELRLTEPGSERKAERWLQRARRLALQSGSKSLELRASVSLARFWLTQESRLESREC